MFSCVRTKSFLSRVNIGSIIKTHPMTGRSPRAGPAKQSWFTRNRAVEQQHLNQDHLLYENTKIAWLLHLSLEWRGVGWAGPKQHWCCGYGMLGSGGGTAGKAVKQKTIFCADKGVAPLCLTQLDQWDWTGRKWSNTKIQKIQKTMKYVQRRYDLGKYSTRAWLHSRWLNKTSEIGMGGNGPMERDEK